MSTAFQYSTAPYVPVDRSTRASSTFMQSVVDHGGLDRDPYGSLDRNLTPADIAAYKTTVHKFREIEDKLEYESEASHRSALGPFQTWKTKDPMLTAAMIAEDPRKYMREGSRAIRKGLAGAIVDAEDSLSMRPISVRNMAPRDFADALASVVDPATATATKDAKIPDRSFYEVTTEPSRSIDVMNHVRGGTTKASKFTPFKQVSRALGRSPLAHTEPNPTIVMRGPLDDAERNPPSAAIFAEIPTKQSPPTALAPMYASATDGLMHAKAVKDSFFPSSPIRLGCDSCGPKTDPMRASRRHGGETPQSIIASAEFEETEGGHRMEPYYLRGAPIRAMAPEKLPVLAAGVDSMKDPVIQRILENAFSPDLKRIGPVAARELRYAEVGFPGSNASDFFTSPRQVPTRDIKTERDYEASVQTPMVEERYGFRFPTEYRSHDAMKSVPRSYPARGAEDKLLLERALQFQPDYTADIAERAMVTGAEFIEPLNVRYELMRDVAMDMTFQRDSLVREKRA